MSEENEQAAATAVVDVSQRQTAVTLALSDAELLNVLGNSVYPGAKPESVKMVLHYCRAAGLDPLQKPVHLVPMSVSTGRKNDKGYDIKETRDVVMPGIGLYRTNAARTKQYVGMSEPVYGPTRAMEYCVSFWENGKKITNNATLEYPEWCKVTVRRLIDGQERDFPAVEYWLENYATQSAGSLYPNAVWARRPFGQIAKCAEAQALRKAFPEVGAAPTAEEMAGKTYEETDITQEAQRITHSAPEMPQPKSKTATPAEPPPTDKPEPGDDDPISGGELAYIKRKIAESGLDSAALMERCSIDCTKESFNRGEFSLLKAALMRRA